MRPVGRVHRKLVALLEAEGFRDVNISPQVGHCRTSKYADVVRWEGWATAPTGAHSVCVYSWDTMTSCARHGISVGERDKGTARISYEIHGKLGLKPTDT